MGRLIAYNKVVKFSMVMFCFRSCWSFAAGRSVFLSGKMTANHRAFSPFSISGFKVSICKLGEVYVNEVNK